MERFKRLILLLGGLLFLVSCSDPSPWQERARHLAEQEGDIRLAVVWPFQQSKASLGNGVDMAIDEINRSGGILGGRHLAVERYDDGSSLTRGRLVAQQIANDPEIAAVIGHLNSYIAIPASLIYERAGLLMMSPGASGQKLTESGHQLVFRSLTGNRDQGRQMGNYAAEQGYKNIAIYYIKNDYGNDLANAFEQRANELGITIVDRRSYDKSGDNYSLVLGGWSTFLKPDAIFLAGSLPESATIIREAREAGLQAPIFGGVGLDSVELIEKGGEAVEGTVVFALFNSQDPRPEVVNFAQEYQQRFGELPDSAAAQGYDTVHLLAYAMSNADSTLPTRVADVLRNTQGWSGVTGLFTFSEKGDLVDKTLAKVVVREDAFRFFQRTPAEVQ